MRRTKMFVAACMLLTTVLAACGQTQSGTSSSTSGSASSSSGSPAASSSGASSSGSASPAGAASGGKTQLRLTTWAGVDESAELQQILDRINGESQTFEIVHEPQPAEYYIKLQTTISGGQAADLMWLSQEYIPGYAERGALQDVSQCLASSGQPAANLDDYFPEVLQTAQYDNKTYGLPWISQPVLMYYNEQLFQQAGVDVPNENWTWDDFKSAAQRINKPDQGIYGTAYNIDWPPVQMFMWQAGGDVISDDRTQAPIDTPEAIQGAQFFADIVFNPTYAAPENVIKEQGFNELAKNGKVGMFFGGAADDLDYAQTKNPEFVNLKAALVPKGPQNRTTFAWTASTVVNAETTNPEVACEALVALTEGVHNWKIVAPRKSLANAETIAKSVPQKQGSADVIVQAAQDMRSFKVVPQQTEWDTTFFEKFKDPLFRGQGTAQDLAPAARQELEAILQGP